MPPVRSQDEIRGQNRSHEKQKRNPNLETQSQGAKAKPVHFRFLDSLFLNDLMFLLSVSLFFVFDRCTTVMWNVQTSDLIEIGIWCPGGL